MTARLLLLVASSAAFAATTPQVEKPAVPEVPAATAKPAASTPPPVSATPAPAAAPAAAPAPAETPKAVPQRFPETRYAKLRSNAPFALATAEVKAPEVEPWAQNLYVGSVAKMKQDGVEKDWVVLKDRTQPGALIQLFGNDVNTEGYQLVKLEWSEEPRKTKASVKKGTEFATVEFDQAAFTSTAPPPGPAPGAQKGGPVPVPRTQASLPGMNGVPIQAGAGAIRPPTAGAPINRPSTPMAGRPPMTIPRPTNLPPTMNQPPMPQNPAMAPNSNTRQRIRVIPSNPVNQ